MLIKEPEIKKDTNSCTLKRTTTEQLLSKYTNNIKNAQLEYISKLNYETKFLETNYMKCCEMDFKLGKNPTVTENSEEDTTSN